MPACTASRINPEALFPQAITQPDVSRIRWLCHASPDDVAALGCNLAFDDPPIVHGARILLHLTDRLELDQEYIWSLLQSGPDDHIRTLSLTRRPSITQARSMHIDSLP